MPLSRLIAELNLVSQHCPTGESTNKSRIHQPRKEALYGNKPLLSSILTSGLWLLSELN